MKEIGSEFWLTNTHTPINSNLGIPNWLKIGKDNKLLLSGRTAIDFVIKDIKKSKNVTNVYFPSYCCQSMLQPFIDNGISIKFYDISFDKGIKFNIDINTECDIFFAINYFGFSNGRMDKYIEIFKNKNIIVIEDSTHSLLSRNSFNTISDYIVASLRKWFPIISGGLAVKTNSRFNIEFNKETLNEMVSNRKQAMTEKAIYMENESDSIITKNHFLNSYRLANEILNKNYEMYSIDKDSLDILHNINIKSVIKSRIKNAKLLYEKLQDIKEINFIFSGLEEGDCPIFLPLVFENQKDRNTLREYLISKKIYCPIHWPKPSIIDKQNSDDIYNKELSLVIDQRYDEIDMQYQIRRIKEFYE